MADLKNNELICLDDLTIFFENNVLDEISDNEELDEYLSQLNTLGKSYRDVHTLLSAELGEDEHTKQYPKHQETRQKVNKKIQDAKRKLRLNKRSQTKSKSSERENDLLCEKNFLVKQSEHLHGKFLPVKTTDMTELSHAIDT